MTTDYLETQLEKWQRLLLLFLGSAITLSLSTLGIAGDYTFSFGWVTIWVVLQLGTIPAGLLLLAGREWRNLPLSRRLNTAFGYLAVAWLCWLAIGFRIAGDSPEALTFILIVGAMLGGGYLLMRRTHVHAPEEMFP